MQAQPSSASDGADDALEPSARVAAESAAGLTSAGGGAGGGGGAAAAGVLNVSDKKEKQKLDKDKRVQERLQVMCAV